VESWRLIDVISGSKKIAKININCQNFIHSQLYHGQVVDTHVKLILNQITPNESSQYEVVVETVYTMPYLFFCLEMNHNQRN